MKKIIPLCLLSLIPCIGTAQDGNYARYGIEEFNPQSWYEINPAAWNAAENFDAAKAFGTNSERLTLLEAEYSTSFINKGKKIAGNCVSASFEDRGALFAGEGYTTIRGLLPTDADYAKRLDILGGWVYNLTEYVDFDIGGNISLTSKRTYADGRATNVDGLGEDITGDIYIGFIGKCFLQPFVYGVYNFDFYQYQIMAGFAPKFDLYDYTKIKGLSLDLMLYGSYVNASRYAGDDKILGDYWHNSYSYAYSYTALTYEYNKTIRISAGVGYSINNDGHGAQGPNGIDLGPDSNVFGTFSIAYLF